MHKRSRFFKALSLLLSLIITVGAVVSYVTPVPARAAASGEATGAKLADDSLPVYKISPKSKTASNYERYSTYSKATHCYYLLRSYMEKLEESGGGTLILKKGTYTLSNTVYVPSNVTIIFNKKVTIKKSMDSGTKLFPASNSFFQLCSPSNSEKTDVYKGYGGVHDVAFIGKGKVTFDQASKQDVISIMMCHNSNITVSGINFKNMYSGHFLEIDASKNVLIENCSFSGHKDSPNNNKEAINLDTPDKATGGFHADWSSYDKTPNDLVTIRDCTFKNLERAIGTHKYSQNKLHVNISITDCDITGCDKDAIRVMNWKDFTIKNNTIDTVTDGTDRIYRAILVSGGYGMDISCNTLKNVARPVQIMAWKNSDAGSEYDTIYNEVTDEEAELMKTNTLINGQEYFIRWNKVYEVYNTDTVKIPVRQGEAK
ncbi:MAG: right-handed parallel beta-helix repeat-containing protein [Lachnospiraceae bacterium]|nr:right-handed parallel beta-helix repeat-containing protein [Lachnospiraceae bacterium]